MRSVEDDAVAGSRSSTTLRAMLVVFVSILQLAAIANAFVRFVRDRFVVGTLGALVRALLLVVGALGDLSVRAVTFPGSDVPAPPGPLLIALAAAVLGPLLSFALLWVAHRRRQDVPAADEERLARPFMAWLPVALFDAAFVVINVCAWVVSRNA